MLNKGKYGITPNHKFTRKTISNWHADTKKSSIIAIRTMEDDIM